ncbi:MAG: hypothetical protein ABI583_11730 [Betaproteobacteria bacterium]
MEIIINVLPSVVIAFVAIGFLPKYLITRPDGYMRVLVLTFLVIFVLHLFYLQYVVARFELLEAILRSIFVAVVPIIAAYVYVRISGKEIIEHWKQAGIWK